MKSKINLKTTSDSNFTACSETVYGGRSPFGSGSSNAVETADMERFGKEFCQTLILDAGLEKDCVRYKKAADRPVSAGDQILVEFENINGEQELYGLHVKELYKHYLSGVSLEEISSTVLKQLNIARKTDLKEIIEHLHNYESAKNDLFIRLLNLERNKEKLDGFIYRTVGDIALVLYMRMGQIGYCTTSIKIPGKIVKIWGLDAETVFQNALLNTLCISPPRIYCWEKLIFDEDYDGENFMSPISDFQMKKDAVGNCLSTSSRTNGAVAIFLPGVAKRLGELLEHSFYMVFTSIHEVMIHVDTEVDPEDLSEVLRETIREATPEEDFLTYRIYHYDRDTHKFSIL